MPITTAITDSCVKEAYEGKHNLLLTGGNTFKLALIKPSMAGTYGKGTTNYSDVTGNSDEVSGTGYSAGGITLTRIDPLIDAGEPILDFENGQILSSTIDARGAIIYNSTNGNRALYLGDFGATKSTVNGTFDIFMPSPTAGNGLMRFA